MVDLLVPDVIPFVDEVQLGLATVILARSKIVDSSMANRPRAYRLQAVRAKVVMKAATEDASPLGVSGDL